jgi:uncharacterized protein YbjT (DUF2867 family)
MVALVIGATGLVGAALTDQLLSNEQFEKVKVFTRRSLQKTHPKLEEHVINFDQPELWKRLVSGDVLFSALGTTLKKAGSKGAQFKVDYKYQYNVARAASENGVPGYILVSAAGSSPTSKIFYSRIKGNLEKDIKKLSFRHITILRPGILSGNRKEERPGERLGISLLNVLHHLPGLRSFKPIPAATVAKAMINAVTHHPEQTNIYTLAEVFKLADLKTSNK